MSDSDPRSKNRTPETADAKEYLHWYAQSLSHTLSTVNPQALEKAIDAIEFATSKGRRIWSAGNGGSAAISDHLCCDWTKGTFLNGHPPIRSHSLTANAALLTAIANDFGYETGFARQVEMLGEKGDLTILISSSGNSPNVLEAAKMARAKEIMVIALTGFSGGALAGLADIHLHAATENYGLVEDCHQALMHIMAQVIFKKRKGSK